MEIALQTLLIVIGGNAALVAAFAWIVRTFFAHRLTKDIKLFEAELKAKADTSIEQLKNSGSFEFRVGKHDCHTRKAGIQRFLSAMRDDRLDDTPLSFPSCSRGSQGKLASGMTSSLTHSKLERAKRMKEHCAMP